jgi:[histone H4]-N-methyl-L-lysine20 N-methyltransferase
MDKNPQAAMLQLERLPCIKNHMANMKTANELEHFKRHLEKYVRIYLPECPFEVTTTNRYTIDTQEASITARKAIRGGEKIMYLTGHRVVLHKHEEAQLENTQKNFSIVTSSRTGEVSIFLGPARFANHDCSPNAQLSPVGDHGMQIVATRRINPNDEITVSYGEGYFGDNNCDCLCATCEKLHRNGWNKSGSATQVDDRSTPSSESGYDVTAKGYSLRGIKKRVHIEASISRTATPEQPARKKRKLNNPASKRLVSQVSLAEQVKEIVNTADLVEDEVKQTPAPSPTPTALERNPLTDSNPTVLQEEASNMVSITIDHVELSEKAPDTTNPSHLQIHNSLLAPESLDESDSISASTSSNIPSVLSANSPQSTTGTSVSEEVLSESHQEDKTISQLVIDQVITTSAETTVTASTEPTMTNPDEDTCPAPSIEIKVEEVETTTLSSIIQSTIPQSNSKPPSKSSRSRARSSLPAPPKHRFPGDYVANKGLLAKPHTAWMTCEQCAERWIQENAYEPRINCPRCERHSKLYGFGWPKTERAGPQDKEIQITDHREVDRIVQKRKKWDEEFPSKAISTKRYGGIWANYRPGFVGGKEKKAKKAKSQLKTKGRRSV